MAWEVTTTLIVETVWSFDVGAMVWGLRRILRLLTLEPSPAPFADSGASSIPPLYSRGVCREVVTLGSKGPWKPESLPICGKSYIGMAVTCSNCPCYGGWALGVWGRRAELVSDWALGRYHWTELVSDWGLLPIGMVSFSPMEELGERFWSKVNKPSGCCRYFAYLDDWRFTEEDPCWIWIACQVSQGYGRYHYQGETQSAHCVAYAALVGPIPEGMELDHLCRVRNCVNPNHLEPVTNRENVRRGSIGGATAIHCKHGHRWTEETTRIDSSGTKRCRVCCLARGHRRKDKKREAKLRQGG